MKKDLFKLNQAWKDYIINGQLKEDIGLEIKKSWDRCKEYEVNPLMEIETPVLEQSNLRERLDEFEQLIRIATPIMENLYQTIEGSNFIVLLTDSEGCILKSIGNNDFKSQAQDVHLVEGANWNERVQGTNAIGTVIEEKSSLNVYASEHFFKQNHLLTCSAAPIFSPTQKLLGVLNISGHYQMAHLHTLGIVETAACLIQNQFQLLDLQSKLTVAEKKERLFLNLVSEGLITLNKEGVITQINQKGSQILGYSARDCVGKRIDEFFVNSNFSSLKEIQGPGSGWSQKANNSFPAKEWHIISDNNQITDLVIKIDSGQSRGTKSQKEPRASYTFANIVGESKAIKEAIMLAKKVADSDSTILLTGESGTGKELFAQAIHNQSFRGQENFVTVNCGALPKDLIESELFGYSDGAFTGARSEGRTGKFQLANGGTIFLDEIGELPLAAQVKLLRTLQERKVSPLGSNEVIPVDVRVIAATNRDLKVMVEGSEFREDLYYRLNVIQIEIPPLEERGNDIIILAEYLVQKLGIVMGKKGIELAAETKALLKEYHWPGNVRELENIVERALNLVSGKVIEAKNLPEYLKRESKLTQISNDQLEESLPSLKEAEATAIRKALNYFEGNVTQTAEHLQIARNTLYRKIKEYGIEV